MNILFLRGFNNYFNRIVKKYSALSDYQNNSSSYLNLDNINFNPNDGVATELIVGNENQKENSAPLDWENIGTPDYAVCYEMENTTAVIKFRWFVLESERTRTGQYRLALKRDVIADHYNHIMDAPCFIEKGFINDIENPLLYNKESLTFNQIKKNEYKLKDKTNSAWIVGYVAKNQPTEASTVSTKIYLEGEPSDYIDADELPFTPNLNHSIEVKMFENDGHVYAHGIAGIPYIRPDGYTQMVFPVDIRCIRGLERISINRGSEQYYNKQYPEVSAPYTEFYPMLNTMGGTTVDTSTKIYMGDLYWNLDTKSSNNKISCYASRRYDTNTNVNDPDRYSFTYPMSIKQNYNYIPENTQAGRFLYSELISSVTSQMDTLDDIDIEYYNNKIVKINNQFYLMKFTYLSDYKYIFKRDSNEEITNGTTTKGVLIDFPNTANSQISAIETELATYVSDNVLLDTSQTQDFKVSSTNVDNKFKLYALYMNGARYSVEFEPLTTELLEVSNPLPENRISTYDSVADMFIIPYGEFKFKEGNNEHFTSSDEGLAVARAIATKFSDACYDIQLVPYCPSLILRNLMETYEFLPMESLESNSFNYIYKTIGENNPEICSFVFWCSSCKGKISIPISIPIKTYTGNTALNYKISNETQVCRFASPNFNGMFELSLAKNNGILNINVDYTYKPYKPYIHINPDFKFIYGQDWKDARGLICGGDFSLAFINSYWQNYQNNNKNYQQIFDRQIQNMDINNSIAMEKQQLTATLGTITGTLGGAVSGAMTGAAAGPWGALAGGIIGAMGGGAASAIAGQKDTEWLERQQKEARSYAIDMYGYQLGNIQAMPYSLTGSESLTNNNKIWPIIEIYEPRDEEIDNLINKIKYNGMTIMAIGKLSDYNISIFDKTYVQGKIIKLDFLNDDFHIADAIYQEVSKGLYI